MKGNRIQILYHWYKVFFPSNLDKPWIKVFLDRERTLCNINIKKDLIRIFSIKLRISLFSFTFSSTGRDLRDWIKWLYTLLIIVDEKNSNLILERFCWMRIMLSVNDSMKFKSSTSWKPKSRIFCHSALDLCRMKLLGWKTSQQSF